MTETAVPLTGVHHVDWMSLEHGSRVPALLADLAGGDPTARSAALRDLYLIAPDGVDVRPWVAAALPVLLELVADTTQPERGRILRLIGDLSGADRTWYLTGETLRAKQLLAGCDRLTGWLADGDPQVRDAAAYTVRAVSRLTSGLPERLWERYVEEPDPVVRATLVCSSVITGAVGSGHQPTRIWLAWVADSDGDLRVRITALTELLALPNPPPFDAETARDTLLAAYREGLNRQPAPPDAMTAPLLAGWRMAARRWTPGYHQVVSAVRTTYRNDVRAHLDLLEKMLDLDAPDAWQDALFEARSLVQRLRGPFRPLVQRAGELLRARDALVRASALRLLSDIGEVARPGADAVWAALPQTAKRMKPDAGDDGRIAWVVAGAHGPELGPAVRILAGLRDERLLPVLHRLLDEVPDADGLHRSIAGYGIRARGLSRTLRRRLRALRPEHFHEPGRYDRQRAGLLHALTAVAPNDTDHLAGEPIDMATLGLLTRAGRAAAGRIPELRALLTQGDPTVELAAASAIWHVAGDAAAAEGVYRRYFDDRRAAEQHVVAAIDGLGMLGIRVSAQGRRLARHLRGRSGPAVQVAAAGALWRVAGSKEAARTLGRIWETVPELRPRIARVWVETGNAGFAARYARSELDTPVRHNVSSAAVTSAEVTADERLLGLCRELVA